MAGKTVLSVGQCMADHYGISMTLRQHFEAETTSVDSAAEAFAHLQETPVDLVLVNRVFDRDGASGLDIIRKLKADQSLKDFPVMLVSNFDSAQREAVKAGAVPGFGKAALGDPAMLESVRTYLG